MRSEARVPEPLGVVVTGGSSGLGFALVAAFLKAGDRVVTCGRDAGRLDHALRELRRTTSCGELHAVVCDVSNASGLESFASFVRERLGRVDRWINNAGSAGRRKRALWELGLEESLEVISTNLCGSAMACSVVVRLMLEQPGSAFPVYHIFNMGFSRAGARFSRSSVPHRASKTGVAAVSRFLLDDLCRHGVTSIGVHELSPGLVKTPLLFSDVEPQTARFLDALAEKPELVAEKLVPKIRAIGSRGGTVRYSSFAGTFFRALVAMVSGAIPGVPSKR